MLIFFWKKEKDLKIGAAFAENKEGCYNNPMSSLERLNGKTHRPLGGEVLPFKRALPSWR